jgi:serine/threonine protein phosphatase PrpC
MKMVGRTHAGLQRMRNEDALGFDSKRAIAVVADGMGGLMAGAEASRIAVDVALERLSAANTVQAQQLADAIALGHQTIVDVSAAKEMTSQMGSTVVIWSATKDRWCAAWVGDSRLYQWHQGALAQLSKDHSLAQRMLDSGEVESGVDVEAHYGHVLTQGLGLRQPLDPGFCGGELGAYEAGGIGQRFLLCSDGLSDLVSEDFMAQVLARDDLESAAEKLLGRALDMGGHDNISLILIEP